MDPKELIRQAIRPFDDVPLYLAGERTLEWEALQRRLEEAQRQGGDSLEGSPAVAIAREIQELEKELAEHRLVVSVQALTRPAYRKLLAEHPPRRGEDGEYLSTDVFGYNPETFLPAVIRACWRSPDLDPADRDYLLDELLTDRQFEELAMAAVSINRGKVNVPFSRAASTMLQTSDGR